VRYLTTFSVVAVLALFIAGFIAAVPAAAQDVDDDSLDGTVDETSDRHAGYYYPEPQTQEVYVARAQTLHDSDRTRRLAFVTALTQQQLVAPYPPGLAIFAKGDEADKLIMVALRDDLFDSVYRMRGVLAVMTASARTSDLFRSYNVQDIFTFFDLLKLLGFRKLTLTDGKDLAHVVYLK